VRRHRHEGMHRSRTSRHSWRIARSPQATRGPKASEPKSQRRVLGGTKTLRLPMGRAAVGKTQQPCLHAPNTAPEQIDGAGINDQGHGPTPALASHRDSSAASRPNHRDQDVNTCAKKGRARPTWRWGAVCADWLGVWRRWPRRSGRLSLDQICQCAVRLPKQCVVTSFITSLRFLPRASDERLRRRFI